MSASDGKRASRIWQFGGCEYVEISRKLIVNGQTVKMEPKPLDVLLQLLEHSTEVVAKDHLLDAVWPEVATTEQSLTVAIAKLRKAFGGSRDSILLNVAGIGYRFAVPVLCVVEEAEEAAPVLLQPGDAIPKRPNWVAVKQLSSEGAPAVWLARHLKTQEERVYKFAVDGLRLRALQREVTISLLLQRSLGERARFAVRVLDWSFEAPPYFTESEYCGPDLLEWSRTEAFRATSLEERVRMAASLASGIALAHSVAVFHNDLKPANILIAPAGPDDGNPSENTQQRAAESAQIKVADFGVASIRNLEILRELNISDHGNFSDRPEGRSRPVGTQMYRAPELHAGAALTEQGDVYALGVLLYQLGCGDFYEPPSPGWEHKISDPLLREDIADAANVNPGDRITTVAELASRLRRFEERRKEKRERDEAAQRALRAQEALARARLRRPWVILTMALLVFGLVVSLWSVQRIARDRNATERQNFTLTAMYDFLALDLLGQSNPYLGVAGSGRAPEQTLVDAMATAEPQIDGRFSQQPEVAGRLHETIADSLKSRTRFAAADEEFAKAARCYREAQGELSQQALIVELKREYVALSGLLPGAVDEAKQGFAQQQQLIARLDRPSAELQAWQALVNAALLGLSPHPEQAVPVLTAAVRRAESTPGFDPLLLVRMKNVFCGLYVRLGDGVDLERVSRDSIAILTRQHGTESATLFPYQMYLEEAFYLQGRYADAIAQADHNFARFDRILGREHQLTLATLATRAAAEAQLGRYADAVHDDLALYSAEQHIASGKRMEEGSLSDAAQFECRAGDYDAGIRHARQVMQETGAGPQAQPMFLNQSMLTVAECEIARQEAHPTSTGRQFLDEAETLLSKADVDAIAEFHGDTRFLAEKEVALARLALLRGQFAESGRYVAAAEPLFTQKNADPYEENALQQVKRSLARHPPADGRAS